MARLLACTLPILAAAVSHVHEPGGEAVCGDGASECSSLTDIQSSTSASLMQVRKQSQHTDRHFSSRQTGRLGLLENAPCSCESDSTDWIEPAPRKPRCIFIDLGAADGNTFHRFMDNGYGNVSNCPSNGDWEAILVEANPIFGQALMSLQSNYSGPVRSLVSAAYMCEGTTTFYLDTIDVVQNFWGSSMSPNARDVQRSGKKQITVPLTNVARLIVESTLPEDYVMVKMDIEGAEHDIVPCLVQSRASKLIDALYVEKHPVEWSLAKASPDGEALMFLDTPGFTHLMDLQTALSALRQGGINVPEYNTPSF